MGRISEKRILNTLVNFLSSILYYLVLKPISLLPMPILYVLSNIVSFFLENIFAYRKEVITNNLKNAFPDKSINDIKLIKNKFYTHFTDVFIESLKGLSLSKEKAKTEVDYKGIELLDQFYNKNQDIILVLGHIGNWEKICINLPLFVKFKILGVYKPLKNTFFNKKVKQVRSKFGLDLVAMQDINKRIKEKTNKPKAVILIGDQSPSNPQRSYWTRFLNQETGILTGTEKFAKIYDLPVIYLNISREKRGHYEVSFELLSDGSKNLEKGRITSLHTSALEDNIIRYPHLWLWSHKRWKHKKA